MPKFMAIYLLSSGMILAHILSQMLKIISRLLIMPKVTQMLCEQYCQWDDKKTNYMFSIVLTIIGLRMFHLPSTESAHRPKLLQLMIKMLVNGLEKSTALFQLGFCLESYCKHCRIRQFVINMSQQNSCLKSILALFYSVFQ